MAVYKKEDIPAHFHYRHNVRIMPILIEAKEGWTVMLNRTGPFMCMYSNLSIPVSACTQLTCFLFFVFFSFKQVLPALIMASEEIF